MTNEEVVHALTDVKNELKQEMVTISAKMDSIYAKMFVGNGTPSFEKRLTIFEQNQLNCPARKAVETESKNLRLNYFMGIIAICAFIISLFNVLK